MTFKKFDDWYKGDHEQIKDLFKLLMISATGGRLNNDSMLVQLDAKGGLVDVVNQEAVDAMKERGE